MARGNQKIRVLVALSGGVDSAVSARLLLKKGYYVEGAFMKNWTSREGLLKNECPWLADRRDALRAAAFLGIQLHTLDFENQYQKKVMRYFFEEYKKGRTPNPDVMCNKEIKFKLLYDWARRRKFDYLATGHYAQIYESRSMKPEARKKGFKFHISNFKLMRSRDEFKDQTYFIYNIKTEQLPKLLFPIGGMKKSAVRALAKKTGLPNAEKKESMGLCFVGKIRLKDFLAQKLRTKKGKIILSSLTFPRKPESKKLKMDSRHFAKQWRNSKMTEQVIGEHLGLYNYTLGQRQGIQVGQGGPYYVIGKDLRHNRLYVTNNPDDDRLLVKEVRLHGVNWINKDFKHNILNLKLAGRCRHQGELAPLTISRLGKDHYRVIFKTSQKAVAAGQSLALYRGKECVGGGVIA